MIFDLIILQAEGGGGEGGEAAPPSAGSFLIPLILIFVVFYFFMIRPQQKKAKNEAKFRETLKKGDKVTTIGGIYGRIVSIETHNNAALVEVDDGVKLKMDLAALKAVPETEPNPKK